MRAITLVLFSCLAITARAQPMIVDGQFDDWPENAAAVADPAGDSAGELDAVGLCGVLRGTSVFIALAIAEPFNLQAGSQTQPDLAMVIDGGAGVAIEIQFRGRMAIRRDTGATLPWDAIRYSAAPTVASDRFEIRVDLAAVGGVADHSVTVTLEGADTVTEPLVIREAGRAGPPGAGMAPELRRRDLRVASLNTLRTGLFAPAQAAALGRLLVAAEADIYLLQEEYNSSEVQVRDLFNSLIPLGKGAEWRAHKRGDCVIVTRWPIQPLPNHDPVYAAAAVLTEDGPLVVISQHPKCCGYIGSSEDLQRIQQAERTAQLVREVRDGAHGDGLSEAAVLIGGDWNLVGSRTPLDILTRPQLPHLAEVVIVNRGAGDVSTWRELDGLGFPPGRLDLIVADADRLEVVGAQVFDTAHLSAERLAHLGVEAQDSRASDHLMLLADFIWSR